MTELINKFISWAKNNNWKIIQEKNDINNLPDNNLLIKYNIPGEYKTFLENIKMCENNEQTVWFLCINDYSEESRSSFIWDEYKNMCSQYPYNEDDEIENYFKKFLPVVLNIRSEHNFSGNFKYYAINTETNEIIYGHGLGYGEEFENIKVISNDFISFLNSIINEEIII